MPTLKRILKSVLVAALIGILMIFVERIPYDESNGIEGMYLYIAGKFLISGITAVAIGWVILMFRYAPMDDMELPDAIQRRNSEYTTPKTTTVITLLIAKATQQRVIGVFVPNKKETRASISGVLIEKPIKDSVFYQIMIKTIPLTSSGWVQWNYEDVVVRKDIEKFIQSSHAFKDSSPNEIMKAAQMEIQQIISKNWDLKCTITDILKENPRDADLTLILQTIDEQWVPVTDQRKR